jgi:hypothetical protein
VDLYSLTEHGCLNFRVHPVAIAAMTHDLYLLLNADIFPPDDDFPGLETSVAHRLPSVPVNPRDPLIELRERLAQAHREAAAALDAGDDEGYETAVAVGEIYRMRLASVRGHGVSSRTEVLHSVPRSPKMASEMLGQEDSRALKIAKTRTKGRKRHPVVQAIYDAGLTPQGAAELCGTKRDVLKQAWGKGDQFREVRPEWRKTLAKHGVPAGIWPSKG